MTYSASFNDAVQFTLREEGVLSDNPNDKGGLTKYGVTQAAWIAYIARFPKDTLIGKSVASISVDDAIEFYHSEHWNDKLPRELQGPFFDFSVNSGKGTASKKLQALIGVEADGDIGPATLAKLEPMQAPALRRLRNDYVTSRLIYDMDVAQHNPKDVTFIEGWARRVVKLYDFNY